jgi:uncharacterized protein (UPF0335 family)
MQEDIQKFAKLQEQNKKNQELKIRLEERLKSEKEALQKVLGEVSKAGYDPKNLKAVLAEKTQEFKDSLSKFEKNVLEVSEQLNAIEA